MPRLEVVKAAEEVRAARDAYREAQDAYTEAQRRLVSEMACIERPFRNVSALSRVAGLSRQTLYRLMGEAKGG